jgi:hypothetical protein
MNKSWQNNYSKLPRSNLGEVENIEEEMVWEFRGSGVVSTYPQHTTNRKPLVRSKHSKEDKNAIIFIINRIGCR